MTINTKEAMDEIYGIFNQPVKNEEVEEEEDDDESDDDDYTSGAESTTTGKISANVSEYGDETRNEIMAAQGHTEIESEEPGDDKTDMTGWSDFTSSKHVPKGDVPDENDENVEQCRENEFQIYKDKDMEEDIASSTTPLYEELTTPTGTEENAAVKYVPLPPEDYEPVTSQFRNTSMLAQNRLPFMTPIVERTESSLGGATTRTERDYFSTTSKTPSRQMHESFDPIDEDEQDALLSSPYQDPDHAEDKRKVLQPIRTKTTKGMVVLKDASTNPKPLGRNIGNTSEPVNKGPIVKDLQCNPVDPNLRESILAQLRPSLHTYVGYQEHPDSRCGKGAEVKKFARNVSKVGKGANGQDKAASTLSLPPLLDFEGTDNVYTIKRELGAGAFAPVYLVERSVRSDGQTTKGDDEENAAPIVQMGKGAFSAVQRSGLEAIKLEDNPPSAWEFYMIKQAHRRLGVSRPAESIVHAHEMHIFADEGYLVEQFRDQGTLLDLVNLARADAGAAGGAPTSGGIDEALAIFISVELLRTVEALHARGIIHGDLKGDNVLVRFDNPAQSTSTASESWSTRYTRDGSCGWSSKGISLIDFGRGIDMRVFDPKVAFIADWETSEADCAEMREMRPWTYQVDYHGLAGTIHSLLFGKYMAVVAERGGGLGQGASKHYRIREGFKRYWQTEIWTECFELLLNPLSHLDGEEGARLPVTKGLRALREKMEDWLEGSCEKGIGLKAMIRRLEEGIAGRKKK